MFYTKQEIIDRQKFRCRHRHSGLSHPQCFIQGQEKIGYLDIEASNLTATFGLIISYCIKEDRGKINYRVLNQKEIQHKIYDKDLCKDLLEDLKKFDRIITYYGTKFDLPFIRTRCVFWKLKFPIYGEIRHKDAYYVVRNKFRFHRNRLENACEFFGIPAKTHPLKPDIWFKAMSGDKRALNFILAHNKEDVISLELLWRKINEYIKITNTSI